MLTISVCIPAYNSAGRIGDALMSLVDQSLPPDEVIVCDDCSSDNTVEIVRSFGSKLPIRLFRNEQNLGMIRNWNVCLEHAREDLIAFLHDDDMYYPNFISEAAKALGSDDRIGMWVCSMSTGSLATRSVLDVDGIVKPKDYAQLVFSMRLIPPPTTVVFRRRALDCAGRYSETYKYMAEPDLYLRVFAHGFYGFNTKQVLVHRGVPETRFTNRVWFTPLNIRDRVNFIQQWIGHPLLETSQHVTLETLDRTQALAAKALASNLAHLRFKPAHEIISVLLEAQSALEKHELKASIGPTYSLFSRTLAALPGAAKDLLRQSRLRPLLRWAKNSTLRIRRSRFPSRASVQNRNVSRTANDFDRQLEAAKELPAAERYEQLVELFQRTSLADFYAYYVSSRSGPHYHMPWERGELTKLPFDFLLYKQLIETTRPEVVIEIGTQRGWSAVFLASLLRPWGGHVITIDIRPTAFQKEFVHHPITFVHGDATTAAAASQVDTLVAGKKCMVIDDGSHTCQDVLSAARIYSQYVPCGGYYIVEDAFTNRLIYGSEPDALSAIDQFLVENEHFERDDSFDHFVFFSAFQGILRCRSN